MRDRNIEDGVRLFYSYSHQDEELRDELEKHLTLLQRQKLITTWHDRRIAPGAHWEATISGELATADIILLLVSADFIASDYCFDLEMKTALEMHDANDATVIPIILRPVDWSGAPFSALQALPKDARAVTSWGNRDEAFADIAKGIREAITERSQQIIVQSAIPVAATNDLPMRSVPSAVLTPDENLKLPRDPTISSVWAFVTTLFSKLAIAFSAVDFNEGSPFLELDLHHLSFRGTDKPIFAAVLWSERQNSDYILEEISKRAVSFAIVFCFEEQLFKLAKAHEKARKCCVVSPADLRQFDKSHNPTSYLAELITDQINIRYLSPYNILIPAGPNMFFGRNYELERLVKEQGASYAIVGPSRIGKTSLVRQYRMISLRERWHDSRRRFVINLSECDGSTDGALRFIAMSVEPTRQSSRITRSNFLSFCRYLTTKLGGRLELILDEADAICDAWHLMNLEWPQKMGLFEL